jgi:hypothetical protein
MNYHEEKSIVLFHFSIKDHIKTAREHLQAGTRTEALKDLFSSHGEREGEAPTALLAEGAT